MGLDEEVSMSARIPAGSCPDCLSPDENISAITPTGRHVRDDGLHVLCPFIAAELADLSVVLGAAYLKRRSALAFATKHGMSLLWCGCGPQHIYMAVR